MCGQRMRKPEQIVGKRVAQHDMIAVKPPAASDRPTSSRRIGA
jgi:hypothetical protein